MADLVTSLSGFIFPDVFQALDSSDVELDNETVLRSSDQQSALDNDYNTSTAFLQESLTLNSSLDISQEVTIDMEENEEIPITPTKPPVRLPALSPITPTANLKVLMSAASPDIRVLDTKRQKKALFNAIADHASFLKEQQVVRGVRIQDDGTETGSLSQGEDGIEEDGDKPINRKSKSLGLLCQRFLSRYPDYPDDGIAMAISLDAISKDLGVERRRIYDIVNVLESIEMVSRVAKNKYLWHGKMNMDPTLARLKCLGEKKRYSDQIAHLKKLQIQNEYRDEFDLSSKMPFRDISNLGNHTQDNDDIKKEFNRFDDKDDLNSRRDKSLGVMSQKFIMLFLVSQAKVITLDIAARVLIGDINYEIREGSKFKTKVRRLYDIANILTSLEMIQKVHVQEGRGRKPAFRWVGPNPDTSHVDPNDVCIENEAPSRQSFFSTPAAPLLTIPVQPKEPVEVPAVSPPKGSTKKVAWSRHASFNAICEVVERERRSYSSAPSSPVKENQGDQTGIAPTDDKFRQDFEALRSKYPDQMSKIYVSDNADVNQQESPDQSESGTYFSTSPGSEADEGIPSSQCPSYAVPVSTCSPLYTQRGASSFTPKVMSSPMPGSCPVSETPHGLVSFPVSFNVIKSGSPGGTIVPSPGRASVPLSSDAQSVLGGSSATSPSQFSLLTSTSKAVHWSVDQHDTSRRSKRTFKHATNAEFEYQPIGKRIKVDGTSALQRSCQVLASQMKPVQTRIIKIPVNGTILPQPTGGKTMQAIFIRKDVSVLNNRPNSALKSLERGYNVEIKSEAPSVHHTSRTTESFSEGHYSDESKQNSTPDIIAGGHNSDLNAMQQTTTQQGPTISLQVTVPTTESLAKIDSITPSAGIQQLFHEQLGKRHGTHQPSSNRDTKQQLDKTGK
ncbi:transcription factor E2F8-like isoform X2 [Asterias amurensis]|uniref:transcription factor E2F8-like isoform X2 n=1 Tax=Asterias amurensis TaxID=7602 RepID=UPI003AB4D687